MGFIDTMFNPVFNPLLSLGPLLTILIISLAISIVVTLVYKLVTNQSEMKRLKDDIKVAQKQMKESKENPEKVLELQKHMMSKNMQYMKHSFKPTLITFIPIILIFGWLQANIAFDPVMPGSEIAVNVLFEDTAYGDVSIIAPNGMQVIGQQNVTLQNGAAAFILKAAKEGDYFLTLNHKNETYSKEIIVTTEQRYAPQIETFKGKPVKSISLGYQKLRPFGSFSLFGWEPGWLAVYITFSLVFSMGLRKIFRLY